MSWIRIVSMAVLLANVVPGTAWPSAARTGSAPHSVTELEARLSAIDAELEQLASYSLRTGIGSVGYRSDAHDEPDATEWVQVELGADTPIDQIVLVPAILRSTKTGFQANAFPLAFRVMAGRSDDTNGTTVATFGEADMLLPRIAPLVVPCPGTTAAWVRLETSALSPRAWDGKYNLELSEIIIFNGEENVAINKPVRTSGTGIYEGQARGGRQLVDGSMPYLMDAYAGEQSRAFVSEAGIGDQPALTMDLGTVLPLNRLHLHAVELSDVPQSTPSDFGVPRQLLVEGATRPDFSDAVELAVNRVKTLFDVCPITVLPFENTACRYVRLTAVEPYINTEHVRSGSQIGFAEIEIFSQGKNVALGKPVAASFEVLDPAGTGRSLDALTDGRNLYGNILPIRRWLTELARRHDLETERPLVAAELARSHARQEAALRRLTWVSLLLAAGIIVTVAIERLLRARETRRIRERFAADLHDELGANLHAIGLLGDLAKDAVDSPEELIETVDEIRAVTERTGAAARYCADMASADIHSSLPADMRRAARRIMADIKYTFTVEGEDTLNALKPRTRSDLFLFFKETLVNISRHSGAGNVAIDIAADRRHARLTITDDGVGITSSATNGTPPSLKRRARLLRAQVSATPAPGGGTRIELILPTRRWGWRR